MSGKKKHRTAGEFLHYLRGEHSNRERHSFEREMETDPFEKEALEGLEGLSPAEAEADILSLHSRLRKRLARRRRIAIYSAAATVASLLIIGTIFVQIYDISPQSAEESLPEKEIPMITPDQEEVKESKTEAEETVDKSEESLGEYEEAQVDSDETLAEAEEFQGEAKKEATVMVAEESVQHYADDSKQEIAMVEKEIMAVEAAPVQESYAAAPSVAPEAAPEAKRGDDTKPQRMKREKSGARQMVAQREELGQMDGLEVELVMNPDMANLDEVVVVGYPDVVVTEYDKSATMAEPSTGYDAFKKYIQENIQYPDSDVDTTRAVVILKFFVTANGEIMDISPLGSPGPEFTDEATRLLIEGPSWNPASSSAGATDQEVRLRIVFKKQPETGGETN